VVKFYCMGNWTTTYSALRLVSERCEHAVVSYLSCDT